MSKRIFLDIASIRSFLLDSPIKEKAFPYFILTFITVGGMARNLAETETGEFQHESPSVTFISSSFLTISTTHVIL